LNRKETRAPGSWFTLTRAFVFLKKVVFGEKPSIFPWIMAAGFINQLVWAGMIMILVLAPPIFDLRAAEKRITLKDGSAIEGQVFPRTWKKSILNPKS